MSNVVDGISAMFTKPDNSAQIAGAKADQDQQRQAQSLALNKQQQDLQVQAGDQDAAAGAAKRIPRGRRLLMAATGEGGLSSTLGG